MISEALSRILRAISGGSFGPFAFEIQGEIPAVASPARGNVFEAKRGSYLLIEAMPEKAAFL